jgi:nucleoid DNA-binding protein
MAKITKPNQQLAEAYDTVIADLNSKLLKMKEGGIKLGNLGTLFKKYRVIKSALTKKSYLYYQVSFKASKELKKALDK